MHSDVKLNQSSWLTHLGQTMNNLKSSGVKMVSSVTNNPTCDLLNLYCDGKDFKNDSIINDGYVPMYSVLAHRELFNKVGLLKECPYAGTEVEEFSIRMNKMGYKQGISGKSLVYHEGRGTLSQYDKNIKVQEILNKTKSTVLNTIHG